MDHSKCQGSGGDRSEAVSRVSFRNLDRSLMWQREQARADYEARIAYVSQAAQIRWRSFQCAVCRRVSKVKGSNVCGIHYNVLPYKCDVRVRKTSQENLDNYKPIGEEEFIADYIEKHK